MCCFVIITYNKKLLINIISYLINDLLIKKAFIIFR